MNRLKVVILIGGKGTRMSPMTDYWPKEMFPMINKPFLQLIFEQLHNLGFKDKDICLVSSKDKKQIQKYYPQYTYIYDNNSGFSNAILFSKKFVKNNDFMLILGDMLLDGSTILNDMIIKYKNTNSSVFGTFDAKNDFYKYCEVVADKNDRILTMTEKPKIKTTKFSTTGQYIFKNYFFELLKKYSNMQNAFGFTKAMNELQEKYQVFSENGFMLDVGNIENFVKSINYTYSKAIK